MQIPILSGIYTDQAPDFRTGDARLPPVARRADRMTLKPITRGITDNKAHLGLSHFSG